MLPEDAICYIWGKERIRKASHNLFTGLLYFNEQPVEQIYGEGTDQAGIGRAIMNRLKKHQAGISWSRKKKLNIKLLCIHLIGN